MPTLQVRHVPEDLHRRLKVRAAQEGRSLSDLVLAELRRAAARPTRSEILARITIEEEVRPPVPAAELVRAEREAR